MTEYNEAKIILKDLTDLNYKSGHGGHTYYKYWLKSNDHVSLADKNDIMLLDAYQPEEIYSQYIIQVAGKGYIVIDHPTKVYKISNTHKCINKN